MVQHVHLHNGFLHAHGTHPVGLVADHLEFFRFFRNLFTELRQRSRFFITEVAVFPFHQTGLILVNLSFDLGNTFINGCIHIIGSFLRSQYNPAGRYGDFHNVVSPFHPHYRRNFTHRLELFGDGHNPFFHIVF